MSKHTPGSWSIERYKEPYNSQLQSINIVADGLIVAKLGAELGQEQTDTANLIAAAPDLLETLEAVLFHSTNEGKPNWQVVLNAGQLESIKNQIVKAKGGA